MTDRPTNHRAGLSAAWCCTCDHSQPEFKCRGRTCTARETRSLPLAIFPTAYTYTAAASVKLLICTSVACVCLMHRRWETGAQPKLVMVHA